MNSKLVIVVFFFTGLGNGSTSDSTKGRCSKTMYVSKARGTGRVSCGSLELPCKTLDKGLPKLCLGGKLLIDGEGTEESPYSCLTSNKLDIRNSLILESYGTKPAYVSCLNGIEFHSLETDTPTNITIKGISFSETNIVLKDTTAVFNDCMFKNSSPAIDIKVSKQLPQYVLNISNFVFQGNMGCILINSNNGQCNTVNMNLNNVVFQENTISACGLVVILGSRTPHCKQFSVISNWNKVTSKNNSKKTDSITCKYKPSVIHHSLFMVRAHKIQLNFTYVTSEDNTKMRFLGLFCHQSNTYVYKSRYHGHHIKEEGGVMYLVAAIKSKTAIVINVTLIESDFSNNIATKGAALSVPKTSTSLSLNLNFVNVNFNDSYGSEKGCVVSIDRVSSINAILDGLKMYNCSDPCVRQRCHRRHAGICLHSLLDIRVRIQNSIFLKNINGSAIYIKKHERSGNVDVSINNSRFERNFVGRLFEGAALRVLVNWSNKQTNKTLVHIVNSTFLGNKGAIQITNVKNIIIANLICRNNRYFCVKTEYKTNKPMDFQNTSTLMQNSNFIGNEMPFYVDNEHPDFIRIQLTNILFYKNNYDEVLSISFGYVKKKSILTTGEIVLDRVSFLSNSLINSGGYLVGLRALHKGHINVKVLRSIFKDNYQNAGISRSINSLLFFFMPKDAIKDSEYCALFPEYQYNNTVLFDGVTFENNTGSLSLLYLSSGKTSFHKCLFINNFSRHPIIGAHVYVEDQGTTALNINNSSFIQNYATLPASVERLMQFVYAGANGPLQFTNSRFVSNALTRRKSPLFTIQYGGFVWINKKTDLLCPLGSSMIFENLSRALKPSLTLDYCSPNITRLKFSCVMCPESTYSLQRGSFHGATLKQTITECYSCPYGANCSSDIKSTENFWGYLESQHPPKLNFSRCPQSYCQAPHHKAIYNSCYGNRTGTMCGECREGFTESMFNRNCRPVEHCDDGWFWIITGIYSSIVAIYAIYRPSVSQILIDKIFWFRKKRPVPPNSRICSQRKHPSGYSKILFYFYQVADLLSIESHHELVHKSVFLASVISFFNFEIEKINVSSGCPFPGLNAVTKEVFLSLQVFAAMTVVVVIYMLYWLVCLLSRRTRPAFAPYIAAIIEILLLGYERLGHTSLELLNCSPLWINGRTEWRLFLDGNITCWVHWWQYALIAYNIIFIVPFLVVLLIGTTKLRRQQISALQFVAACFVPLPFLVYWFFQRCSREKKQNNVTIGYSSYQNQVTAEALLEVIEGPFRQSNGTSNGALYWDSILIGRRLVFLCLFSFVTTPLLRMYFMTIICVCILIHNVLVMPYKEKKANSLAMMFLFIHVVIATTSLCKAVLINDGVFPKTPTKKIIEGLLILNIVFLAGPPCVLVLLIITAIISQIAQAMVRLTIYTCGKTDSREASLEFTDENDSYRPLLSSMEEE